MKKVFIYIICFFMSANCFAYIFTGVVTDIDNGCSLKIQRRKKIENIKLAGIECSKNASLANRAKQKVNRLALDKKVTVDVRGLDKQGNKLAQVTVLNGANISYELVRDGYAKVTTSDLENPLLQVQRQAKSEQKGLWNTSKSEPKKKSTSMLQKIIKPKTEKNKLQKSANKNKKPHEKKSFFNHSLSEMATLSYDYIKKQVDKVLSFLDKIEKSQSTKKRDD
jgi:endonuclease YncB( thermonuclease family)